MGIRMGCMIGVLFAILPAGGPAQEPKVLASAEHESGGVKVELLEVKRDSPTVVTATWRYRNEGAESKQLTHARTGWVDPYRLALESYLLDEVKRIKFECSRDTDNRPVASRNGQPNQFIAIRPKQTILVWAKYIVPETVTKVTLSIEGVQPFSGIAITK